jgi:hypothetical protein
LRLSALNGRVSRPTARVATLVLAADGFARSEVIVPHAILGPLKVHQWLVIVGAHEGRHADQIRELAAAAGSL